MALKTPTLKTAFSELSAGAIGNIQKWALFGTQSEAAVHSPVIAYYVRMRDHHHRRMRSTRHVKAVRTHRRIIWHCQREIDLG